MKLKILLSTFWGLFAKLKIHQSNFIWFGFQIEQQIWRDFLWHIILYYLIAPLKYNLKKWISIPLNALGLWSLIFHGDYLQEVFWHPMLYQIYFTSIMEESIKKCMQLLPFWGSYCFEDTREIKGYFLDYFIGFRDLVVDIQVN